MQFLTSYSELKSFIQKAESLLGGLATENWMYLKVELSLLGINKFTKEDRLRLLSNDYFINIVPEHGDGSAKLKKFNEYQYNILVNKLLKDIININLFKNITYFKKNNILKINTEDGLIFSLVSNQELLSKFIDNSEITLNIENHFENNGIYKFFNNDSNSNRELKEWFDIPENGRIASIYNLLYLLLKYKSINSSNILLDEDKIFLEKNGYLIVENFINAEDISQLKKLTYQIAEVQKSDDSAYVYGNNSKLQRIYNLIGKSKKYIELILDPRIEGILEYFFKRDTLHQKYYLSSFQANILYPGAESQILHTDLAIPEPLPQWPIRLNINILLDDFTDDNGATLVVPGSHKLSRKPMPYDNQVNLKKLIAPAGSLVIWTGHLWHKSGSNDSTEARAALLACFSASYMREIAVEENYLVVNNAAMLKEVPTKLFELIGGNHGIKVSA